MIVSRRDALMSIPAVGAGLLAGPAASQAAMASVKREIRITDIEVFTLKFPKATPKTWNAIKSSGGKKPKSTFLRLKTNEGIDGVAMVKGNVNDIKGMARKIRGLNLLNVEEAWDHMYFHERKPVAKGNEIHAIGSVDLAVWDIVGKAMDQPVHRLLGTYREAIPAYAAGGYYAEGKGIPELVAEMESYVDEGFRVVKMKVGALSPADDAERVRAVRRALGPDIGIMVDANNGYQSAYEAIRFGRMVEDQDLYWFEEPVMPYDWRGNAEVKEELSMPITAGENEYTRWGALDLLTNDACDIMNPDTIKAGGITEMRKIAALCSAYHVPIAPHGYGHMNVHVFASLPNGLVLETYPKKARDFNPALTPLPLKNGEVIVPMEPGLGMEPDPDLIERYRVA
ncbi:MAG: mandelate racemase/muconate lactonizing enzyme family protein [Pseudomonadota bacterium]